MREWRDQAIILRYGLFHEYDLWLRVLCRKRGMLTFFAFGGAKSRKRFCGCLDVLNSLECLVEESRNGVYLNLREASLLAGPSRLRSDWRAMGMAANCLRFLSNLDISPENAKSCYNLVEDLRDMLETAPVPPGLTPFFFRLKLAALLGFSPDFDTCGQCGRQNLQEGYFFPSHGRIYCPGCVPKDAFSGKGGAHWLSAYALASLRDAVKGSPFLWQAKNLTPMEIRACARCADEFSAYHLGVDWDNGIFGHA